MTHESDVHEIELLTDLKHVLSVSIERLILALVERRKIGITSANMIEKDNLIIVLERRDDETPHILVTPITVREHDRPSTLAEYCNTVAPYSQHSGLRTWL